MYPSKFHSVISFPEKEDLEIEASPYKDIKSENKSAELKDIKKLHSQLNYSNTVLEVMTKQLTRIENKAVSSHIPSSSKLPEKPIYKLFNVPQKELDSLRLRSDTNLKIEELKKKLEDLNKTSINTLELNKIRNYPKLRNFYLRPTMGDIEDSFNKFNSLVLGGFTNSKHISFPKV